MAAVIFSKALGQVQSLPDPSLPANISFRLDDWTGYVGLKSIITRITISAKGNYQFLHTLGGQVYIYVFGDRVGQMGISGLAFDSTCSSNLGPLGIENVLAYYGRNRVANRQSPIRMVLGATTALDAYLLDITADMVDTKSRIWQFSMMLSLIPQDEPDPADTDSGGGSGGDDDQSDGGGDTDNGTVLPDPDDVLNGPPDDVLNGPLDVGGAAHSAYELNVAAAAGYAAAGSGPRIGMVSPLRTN